MPIPSPKRPHHPVPPPGVEPHPISPPLKPIPHSKAPRKDKTKPLVVAVILGSLITVCFGLGLAYFNISINVILPVLAPILVGTITLIYSFNAKH